VDETGIDCYLYREYAWALRGQKVYGEISGHQYQRFGIVAAQMGKRILAPLQYDGTMHSVLFEIWFEKCLLPALPERAVIVMDNATFHRKRKLISLAQRQGHRLIFLPPYSPELNPIENYWSWLKRYLRKYLSLHSSLDDAICSAFNVR